MKYNPLINAVAAYDDHLDTIADLMYAVKGEQAFEPEWDEKLNNEILELIGTSYEAVQQLQPRSQVARLNLIWKDFKKKHGISDKQR